MPRRLQAVSAVPLTTLVGATSNSGTQVGASHIPKTKLGPLATGKAVDVATLVSRLRTSYPVLRATVVDSALRQLLLSELVAQCYREDGVVVLPRNLRVHAVDDDRFLEFKNQLSGLNAENVTAV